MPKIAISYRRSDTSAVAGRIFDRLGVHYGRHSVFMDVDDIPIGIDFRDHIFETLKQTDVLLAVIGAKWMGASADGAARILEETDPVKVEIESAVGQGLAIIPVLVDGAKMPEASMLPESFGAFAFLNAAEVATGRDFDDQIQRLIAAIDRAHRATRDHRASIYASPKERARRNLLLNVVRFYGVPLVLLLVAHFIIVLALDMNIVWLRLVSTLAPLIFGAALSKLTPYGAGVASAFALALGVVATAGMTFSESLATGDPMLPQSRLEWLDNIQFAGTIALSFIIGYLAALLSSRYLSTASGR
jgi:TIR domain